MLWIVILLLAHPTAARCPPTYDLRTGIRRSGVYECWPHPVAPREWRGSRIEDWDGTFGRPERSVQPAGILTGRIWCGKGVPVVLDERRVGCR